MTINFPFRKKELQNAKKKESMTYTQGKKQPIETCLWASPNIEHTKKKIKFSCFKYALRAKWNHAFEKC